MRLDIFTMMTREFIGTFHYDSVYELEALLDRELSHRFHSEFVECMSITLICQSPAFHGFIKLKRPKYYPDNTLKPRNSITPVVRLVKCLTAELELDFEAFYHVKKEECLRFLGLSFIAFLETLKYPGALKKFEKEELIRVVKEILAESVGC